MGVGVTVMAFKSLWLNNWANLLVFQPCQPISIFMGTDLNFHLWIFLTGKSQAGRLLLHHLEEACLTDLLIRYNVRSQLLKQEGLSCHDHYHP